MKKLPIYVALDLDEEEKAIFVAQATAPYVEGFKIGPGLYFKSSPFLISKLKNYGKVFLDFKFFDIPSTMLSAVRSAFDQGVDMLTVHALSGAESLKKLADLESELNQTGFKKAQALKADSSIKPAIQYKNPDNIKKDFKILAVTVLTSFSESDILPAGQVPAGQISAGQISAGQASAGQAGGRSPLPEKTLLSYVESLSDLAIQSGLTGLVCSGQEVAHLRKKYPHAYLLTPGIRWSVDKKTSDHKLSSETKGTEDQSRICTPEQAIKAGASALVIGRPIYESSNPAEVCAKIF